MKCQSCKKHPATREYHDGDELMKLCGFCFRKFRAIDREFDKQTSKVDPDIAPDAWAEPEEEE
jgi:hypothetical protein